MTSPIRCQEILYVLTEYSFKPEFQPERQIAQELYSISTGKTNDDDPFYEQRMSSFQEYFIFEYRLCETFSGSTVYETFLYNAQKKYSILEICELEEFRNFRHSLFQIEKKNKENIVVKDLFSFNTYTVNSLPDYTFAGFDYEQIFEARLISFAGVNYFTRSFILHPKKVRKIIQKYIAEFLKEGNYSKVENTIEWKEELDTRNRLLASVTEQKMQIQRNEKKRAIDYLRVTKKLAELPRLISSSNLIMSLGRKNYISPFIPEASFYDTLPIIHSLAYCEIKSFRYKHIDPIKIYTMVTFQDSQF